MWGENCYHENGRSQAPLLFPHRLWHKKNVPADWIRLSLKAPASALDTISNFLIERGSPGVILKRGEVQAFFPRPEKSLHLKRDVQRFLKGIREIYPEAGDQPSRWSVLKDKNWNSSWRRFFSPQKVGKRLWITPSWIKLPRSSRRHVITIEPGMAFGTGTHSTTRCCLEFLECAVSSSTQKKTIALDVGTGSGILAIALAKMGVKRVLALDYDPIALKVAQDNIRRNRVRKAVRLSNSALREVRRSFTVVAANLTAETIIDMAQELRRRVSPGGHLVLSGILNHKAREVLLHFSGSLVLLRQKREKGWTTLLFRKKARDASDLFYRFRQKGPTD